jgi:hypothetical protein
MTLAGCIQTEWIHNSITYKHCYALKNEASVAAKVHILALLTAINIK